MPPTPASVVEQWQSLPRTVLQDKVRQVVKRRDADARQIWAQVRANSVLAAQVRGALSALRAEVKGTRDEVMWTMWIDQARSVLDAATEKPAAEPAAAEKTVVEKPTVSKPAPEKPAAARKPEPVPAASEPEPDPAGELAFTPQPAEKPRTAPPVPPVMFQAPGT